MSDPDQCCIAACCGTCFNEDSCKCIEKCDESFSCCDSGSNTKEKTREDLKKEEQRMEAWMRIGIYAGFSFAFIAVFTQPHIMWDYYSLFAIFWGLYVLNLYLYEKLRKSYPGYIPLADIQNFHKRKVARQERKAAEAVEMFNSSTVVSQSGTNGGNSDNGTLKRSKQRSNSRSGGYDESEFMISSPVVESTTNEITYELEDPYENTVVLRYRYCKKCEKYISRYDHHCYWLGTCIGEKNHVLFFTFLTTMSIFIFYSFLITLSAMYYAHYDIVFNFSWLKLIFQILVVWAAFFIAMFTFFLPFCLWCHHVYLIATNQTSYEVYRPNKLDYLRNVAENAVKFDEGFFKNCKRFFTELNPLVNRMRDYEYLKYKLSKTTTTTVMNHVDDWCDKMAQKCCC